MEFTFDYTGKKFPGCAEPDQHLNHYFQIDGEWFEEAMVWRAGRWEKSRGPARITGPLLSSHPEGKAIRRARNLVLKGLVPSGTKFYFKLRASRRLYTADGVYVV